MPLDVAAQVWSTPTAHDGRRPGADTKSTQGANLSRDASLWTTPTSGNANGANHARDGGSSLTDDAVLWATPTTGNRTSDKAKHGRPTSGPSRGGPSFGLEDQAALLWATPTVADTQGGRMSRSGARSDELLLKGQAAQWATPTSRDWKDTTPQPDREGRSETNSQLGLQVLATATDGPDGSPPADRPRLNPAFVEALMGFPPGWTVPTVSALSATGACPHKSSTPSESSPAAR